LVIAFAILTVVGFIALLFVMRRVMRAFMGGGQATPRRASEDIAQLLDLAALTQEERQRLKERAREKMRLELHSDSAGHAAVN
jgi:hypothetical protein